MSQVYSDTVTEVLSNAAMFRSGCVTPWRLELLETVLLNTYFSYLYQSSMWKVQSSLEPLAINHMSEMHSDYGDCLALPV